MNSLVEIRAEFIQSKCESAGTKIKCAYRDDPLEMASLTNERGDMASVSCSSVVYEPNLYAPKWSKGMSGWARDEGFSDEQIESQNLLREVTIEEAIDYLI